MAKNKKISRKVANRRKKRSGGFLMIRTKNKKSAIIGISFIVLFATVGVALLFKSFAAVTYNAYDEAIQYHDINKTRSGLGLSNSAPTSCIQKVARDWSYKMATTLGPASSTDPTLVHFRHNPNPVDQIVANCNITGHWQWEAENIAVREGDCPAGAKTPNICSQVIYDSFTSPKEIYNCTVRKSIELGDLYNHYCNITNNQAIYVGVGAYRDGNDKLWITQDFFRCDGCGLQTFKPTYWTLTGKASVSSATAARATSITAHPGQIVSFYHNVINSGPITASYLEHVNTYHYSASGVLLSSDVKNIGSRTTGWGGVYTWSNNTTIPADAIKGHKYCHLIYFSNASGPNTGGSISNKACVTVN